MPSGKFHCLTVEDFNQEGQEENDYAMRWGKNNGLAPAGVKNHPKVNQIGLFSFRRDSSRHRRHLRHSRITNIFFLFAFSTVFSYYAAHQQRMCSFAFSVISLPLFQLRFPFNFYRFLSICRFNLAP